MLVQEMIQGGVEAIVGIVRHETFGPVIVVGTGGVLVELVRDSSVGILPLDEAGARELLSRTRLRSLLQGWRGAPTCDEDALVSLMVRLAGIALAYRDVVSAIDLNPVVVLPARTRRAYPRRADPAGGCGRRVLTDAQSACPAAIALPSLTVSRTSNCRSSLTVRWLLIATRRQCSPRIVVSETTAVPCS